MPRSTPRFLAAGSAPIVPRDVRVVRLAANVLLAAAALLAAVALAWTAAQRLPVFGIRGITLDGDFSHGSLPMIRSTVLPQLTGNYFSLDLRAACRAFEMLPWVRHAVVRRVWPDRLVVTLQEHHAAAYWERDAADNQLLNLQGEVFEANLGDVEDEGLPLLRGPQGSSVQVWEMYRRLTPVFGGLGERITELGLSVRGSWQAELASGAQIELGRGTADEVLARTQRYAATVGQVTSRYHRSVEHADLRHQGAYALRLRGIGTRDGVGPGAAAGAN